MRGVMMMLVLVRNAAGAVGIAVSGNFPFLPKNEPPVVIDLRRTGDFQSQHLVGSASLPVTQLRQRMFELPPPREWPLALIGTASDLSHAREILHPRGWQFDQLDAADSALWAESATASGTSDASTWRPNAFLAGVLRNVQPPCCGVALDMGCGSGRDAVFMAQELGSSWDVIGIDNHVAALDRARALATSCGSKTATFAAMDLRKESLVPLLGESPRLGFVHGCRFLDRALLARLPELLSVGGIVCWSTFMNGDAPAQAPPFRPSRRLDRGELTRLFGADAGFEVLFDVEGELLTRNSMEAAHFFAARRASEC